MKPTVMQRQFARRARAAIAAFYSDPANVAAYERWLEEKNGRSVPSNTERPRTEGMYPTCTARA